MSTLFSRIGLQLPEKRPLLKTDFQVSPKAVNTWLESLPLANAAMGAQALLKALQDTNQIKMSGVDRVHIMEMLRRPALQMIAAIDQQILLANFPLPANKAILGEMAVQFQLALATGYRTALYEICAPNGSIPFLKGGSVVMSMERALHHYGAMLARCYMLYATPVSGIWKLLNDLYRFAVELKIEDKLNLDSELDNGKFSPRGAYVHALLLAISNPYRFAQRESYEAFYALRTWAEQGRLNATRVSQLSFAIAADEDRGPGYLPEEHVQSQAALLWFTPDKLIQDLQNQIAKAKALGGGLSTRLPGGKSATLSVDFLNRMIGAWKPMAEREYKRANATHTLDTLVGLAAVHYFLAGMKDFDAYVREARGSGITMSERDRAASWANASADSVRPSKVSAQVLDQSLGGYRLLWEGGNAIKARVGEVIGLNLPGDEDDLQDWMLAIVRWIRISPEGHVDAGLELLGRETRAAAVAPMDARGQVKTRIRALVLDPSLRGDSPIVSLIASNLLDKSAPRLELMGGNSILEGNDNEVRVLTEVSILEDNGAYLRIEGKRTERG